MVRIIPKLDIKGPDLVKGIHLEGLRVLGAPESFAKYYYDEGADEIIFQDVVASLFERNSLHEIISRTAKDIFIPISVGGGIRSVEDISSVLRSGADRVTLNTIAVRKPSFIKESVKYFGSSTIVVAIEAIKEEDGIYRAFIDNGREYTGLEVSEWVKEVEDLGVGEIIITSVDNEGTGKGFDIELLNLIRKNTSISIIAHGGAGNIENIKTAINTGVNGLALSSCLHYEVINKINRNDVKNNFEGNNLFLKSGMKRKINTLTIRQIKEFLNNNNINIRPV